MKSSLLALGVAVFTVAVLYAEPEPEAAAKAVGVTDLETRRLYEAITNWSWDYNWRHTVVEIKLGPEGEVTKSPWGGATWRISGPHTVVFKTPKSKTEMVAHFNPELTKWTCVDWSRDPAYAIRGKTKEADAK